MTQIAAAKHDTFHAPRPGTYNRKEALCALVTGKINGEVWNKLYKREIWGNTRFPEGYVVAEDIIATYDAFVFAMRFML